MLPVSDGVRWASGVTDNTAVYCTFLTLTDVGRRLDTTRGNKVADCADNTAQQQWFYPFDNGYSTPYLTGLDGLLV